MEIPELHLEKIKENPMCFGCGKANPHSLKMKFSQDGETTRAEFLPNECHQSWPGHVHGGALMALIRQEFSPGVFAVLSKLHFQTMGIGLSAAKTHWVLFNFFQMQLGYFHFT